jgi:hypothetical protein
VDPISITVVTALAAGATAAVTNLATEAVKDAYQGLKTLVVDRYRQSGPLVDALEAEPASAQKQNLLLNQLAGADADAAVKEAAVLLLDRLDQLRNDSRAQAVFDYGKLRAAKSFNLENIEFSGTLLRADDATFEGDFSAKNLRQDAGGGAQPKN